MAQNRMPIRREAMESFLRHPRAGCILRATTMQADIIDPEIRTPLFQAAELRSESTRVGAILGVLAGLLVVIVVRGALGLADGRRGEAWPFAALLAAMMLYELARLRFVRQALALARSVPRARWVGNLLLESLLPAVALFLQIYTPSLG